jgi:membrane-associated phospholipid phosphatase
VVQSQKLIKFLLLIGIASFLLFSLWFPPTAEGWHFVDVKVFRCLNSYLADHPVQQIFWAAASIKITDVFGALFLLGFFLLYVFEEQGEERKKRVVELIYTLIWFEIAMLLCKQIMTPYLIEHGFSRHSPTETFTDTFRLSTVIPSLKVKDSSLFSFPADHATIVFLWCGFLWFFGSWKRGLLAFLFSTIFLLSRLLSGAHWLSDILVGSLSWVLVLMSIALFSPIYDWIMRAISRVYIRGSK